MKNRKTSVMLALIVTKVGDTYYVAIDGRNDELTELGIDEKKYRSICDGIEELIKKELLDV